MWSMSNAAPVLIVAATQRELEPLVARVDSATPPEGKRGVRHGRLANHPVLLGTCGVGKASAAMHTLELLRVHKTSLIVNTGCAGAYPNSQLNIGDVVIGSTALFADDGVQTSDGFLDCQEIGLPLGSSSTGEPIYNAVPVASVALPPRTRDFAVETGTITTISRGSGCREQAEALGRLGLAEAMEGAAVGLAAIEVGCPYLEVRGISNQTGTRNLASWDIDLACTNAAEIVEEIINAWLSSRE